MLSEQIQLSEQILIPLLGIRTVVAPEEPVDHPLGVDTYVFEYFDSEVELEDEDGVHTYSGNVCILYPPGQRRFYKVSKQANRTWFHVRGDGLEPCLERYAIPTYRALSGLLEPSTLITLLEDARRHMVHREPYWEDAVTVLCQTFFRNLSRCIAQGLYTDRTSLYQREVLSTLRHVRAEIHANLDRRWSVEEMAALANLSYSYYRNVFTRFFNVSPIEDLTLARIRRAKLLLRNSKLSVNEIAGQCGFSNTSQFYVCFREKTGRSPGDVIKAERNGSTASASRTLVQDRETIDDVSLLFLEPAGFWRFDNVETDPDQDYHFRYERLHFNHGASVGVGPLGGGALLLKGNQAYAELAEPVVDTSESYTVCAWVLPQEPAAPTDWMTAVSISNEHHCSFYLQYCLADNCFMFTVTPSSTDYRVIHASGSVRPETGKWFHLVGVHDRENGAIMLWENGKLSCTLPYTAPWRAPGSTRFGASVYWGALTDLWTGKIGEVRFYNRVLSESEIQTIYTAKAR